MTGDWTELLGSAAGTCLSDPVRWAVSEMPLGAE